MRKDRVYLSGLMQVGEFMDALYILRDQAVMDQHILEVYVVRTGELSADIALAHRPGDNEDDIGRAWALPTAHEIVCCGFFNILKRNCTAVAPIVERDL